MLSKRRREGEDSKCCGWVSKNRIMPPKEETGRTGVDEGDGDSTEVEVPVGHLEG